MLRNAPIKTVAGDLHRRWLADDYVDLFVWYQADRQTIAGFQLCYDKGHREHALTWMEGKGFTHHAVDDGEDSPLANRTPILRPDGVVRVDKLAAEFEARSTALDPVIRDYVLERLRRLA